MLAALGFLTAGAALAQDTDGGVALPAATLEVAAPEPGPVPSESFFQRIPLTVGMFGNVDGSVGGGAHSAFALGGVDLFVTSQPHRSLTLLAEVVFEAGSDQSFVADVERVQAGWVFDPLLRVTVGRMHQALGYYNAAYHHGAFLANSIERPAVMAFEDEGGVLPVHAIGVEAAGELELGDFALGYNVTLSNGRGRNPDEVLNIRDLNPAKSILGGLYVSQISWGARLGLNALYDRIPSELDAGGATVRPPQDEWLLGAHLLVDQDVVWFLAEAYLVDHISTSLGLRRTVGVFAEARVNLRPLFVYGRFDLLSHSDEVDPFFDPAAPAASTRSALLGVGWKVTAGLVLKVEGAIAFPPGQPSNPSGRAQLAWSM